MTATDLKIPSTQRELDSFDPISRVSSPSRSSAAAASIATSTTMLTVNFSTPLTGPARAERIKQMSDKHPAFEKSRLSQQILVKIQHSLRRMPGISASESSEIIEQLQEVGQIINNETTALVDALANMSLDQEETEKALARLSIEGNLAKAETDSKESKIERLTSELKEETEKRRHAEAAVEEAVENLQKLSNECRELKARNDDDGSKTPEIIRNLEETIKHLGEQVNSRRSIWLMKNTDPDSVARAIETLAVSVQDNPSAHRALMSLKPNAVPDDLHENGGSDFSRMINEFPAPVRPQSAFQPVHRTASGPMAKASNFHLSNGRVPSGPPARRYQGSWGSNAYSQPLRHGHASNSLMPVSSFSQMGSRKSFSSSRFSPGDRDSGRWYGQSDGFEGRTGLFARGRDMYPPTPTASNRGRYGRHADSQGGGFQDFQPLHGPGNALVPHSSSGPLVHTGERYVQGWHDSVMELYNLIRIFVENHSVRHDAGLARRVSGTAIWPILLATYYPLSEPEAASYLDFHLRDASSKSCLITRVIIDYIVNRVWVPGAWTGQDSEISYSLLEIERDLEKMHGQTSSLRQPLLDRQATIVNGIIKGEMGTAFNKTKIEEVTRTLLTNLKPLIDRNTDPKDAYQDMEKVAENAWDLSSRILTSRLTFDFRFPEIGSRFSSQSMVPIWPEGDPMELQAKHWRIALVTTPVITCRNDTGTNISAHSVALADVFCMQ